MLPLRRLPLVGIAAICLFTSFTHQRAMAQDTVSLGSVEFSHTPQIAEPQTAEGFALQASERDLGSGPRGGALSDVSNESKSLPIPRDVKHAGCRTVHAARGRHP